MIYLHIAFSIVWTVLIAYVSNIFRLRSASRKPYRGNLEYNSYQNVYLISPFLGSYASPWNLRRSIYSSTYSAVKDSNHYPTGIRISDEDLARLNMQRDDFHGEWNYTISP